MNHGTFHSAQASLDMFLVSSPAVRSHGGSAMHLKLLHVQMVTCHRMEEPRPATEICFEGNEHVGALGKPIQDPTINSGG
jgi:hypothetical protein